MPDPATPPAAVVAPRGPIRFHVELIKPSHYDDDGYVIQWLKAWIPSNSLASLYGQALQAAQAWVLGEGVAIETRAYDETNTRVPVERICARIRRAGGNGIVCLVGVQSNQFPRAMDLARRFRAAGLQVAIGGFHVSGCLAMLPEIPADLREAMDLGITLFAGETEGRVEAFLRAAHARKLEPLYNFMSDLPSLEGEVLPYLPPEVARRYAPMPGTFDAGRGCPFLCSFCTIINVQGRKSRYRSPDDVEHLLRKNLAHGIRCTTNPRMTKAQWEGIYRQAWDAYYSMEHLERLMRRAASVGRNPKRIMEIALQFYGCFKFEGVHPLQGGFIRRKVRSERRPGFAVESPLVFYPRRTWEFASTYGRMLAYAWRVWRLYKRVRREQDAAGAPHVDEAMRPLVGPALARVPAKDPGADLNATDPALDTAVLSHAVNIARPRVPAGLS